MTDITQSTIDEVDVLDFTSKTEDYFNQIEEKCRIDESKQSKIKKILYWVEVTIRVLILIIGGVTTYISYRVMDPGNVVALLQGLISILIAIKFVVDKLVRDSNNMIKRTREKKKLVLQGLQKINKNDDGQRIKLDTELRIINLPVFNNNNNN